MDPRHGALHGRRHPGQQELCGHGRSPVSGAPRGAGVRRGVRARRVESGAGPYCRAVVAADLSAEAIRHLEAQPLPPNVEPRRCDVLADTPDEPYDAMVFCFFGRTDEILSAARRQCTGTVAVLKRCGRDHRFPGEGPPRQGFEELCRELEEKGIPYQSRVLELDMGQPFRSLEDAAVFFRTHSRDDPAELTPRSCKAAFSGGTTRNFRGISR
ncbi:class I SAM-dependent methyltransferase [Flavonifractor plautii]|nr:class I SAM-dependent methyltransferase [Flavonifractor plautii]